MEFRPLTLSDVEQVRQWRNRCLYALRTPFLLTEEMQANFYKDIVCNRNARARYFGIWLETKPEMLIGMCGIENIEWENSCGEISLILSPQYQGKGYGKQAVAMLFDHGFNAMGLKTIYGECYECNPAIDSWKGVVRKYDAHIVYLPNRKLWNGEYYHSMYFSIDREDYNESNNTRR